jgi:hypothetical protein
MQTQSAPQKTPWSMLILIIIWIALVGALASAVWFQVLDSDVSDEHIAKVAESNKDIQALCNIVAPDSRCKERTIAAIENASLVALDDQKKRLWLTLLAIVLGVPILGGLGRAARTALPEQKVFWLTAMCIAILLIVLGITTIAVWNLPDQNVAYVPVPILEWGFAGGMLAVIYRLAYGRVTDVGKLYTWMIARPVIGLFMGGVIYFIMFAGGILVNAQLTNSGQLQNNLWLNALTFIAAFSDKFSTAMIKQVTTVLFKSDDKPDDQKSET